MKFASDYSTRKYYGKSNILKILIITLVSLLVTSLSAQTTWFSNVNTTGVWNNSANWNDESGGGGNPGIPVAGDTSCNTEWRHHSC